ncbi:putative nuclease HARBI1 [Drosophila takahashii]|uniref:putative nuclease HARBI1 n=1 Tax=Drosophila takahashii TaxID=29030 RepID=UPI001CF8EBD7|nr:putative nuclease HARBI1 [Drosophila takahashii]
MPKRKLSRAIYLHSLEDSDEELLVRPRKPRVYQTRPNFLEEMEDDEFINKFRISKATCSLLLQKIGKKMEHLTTRSYALSPEDKLLLALRFYACGNFLIAVGDFCKMSTSSACRAIKEVSLNIAALSREYIMFGEPRKVIEDFQKISKFPNVMGAVGCTHIRIKSPSQNQYEAFRNRKGYFSLNVQIASSAQLIIQDVVARWPGSTDNSTIFENSRLKHRWETGEFENNFLLGNGYAVSKYMMTPITNPTTEAERLYNESQISGRKVVSKCLEVWKQRFPLLSYGMRIHIDTAKVVIVACAVLHNIAIQEKDPLPPGPVDEDLPPESFEDAEAVNEIVDDLGGLHRNNLISTYFER